MSRRYRYKDDSPLSIANEEFDDLWRRIDALEAKKTKKIVVQVGSSEKEIAHGLGKVPDDIHPVPRSDARVWQTKSATDRFVYLAASGLVTVDLYVG